MTRTVILGKVRGDMHGCEDLRTGHWKQGFEGSVGVLPMDTAKATGGQNQSFTHGRQAAPRGQAGSGPRTPHSRMRSMSWEAIVGLWLPWGEEKGGQSSECPALAGNSEDRIK